MSLLKYVGSLLWSDVKQLFSVKSMLNIFLILFIIFFIQVIFMNVGDNVKILSAVLGTISVVLYGWKLKLSGDYTRFKREQYKEKIFRSSVKEVDKHEK